MLMILGLKRSCVDEKDGGRLLENEWTVGGNNERIIKG